MATMIQTAACAPRKVSLLKRLSDAHSLFRQRRALAKLDATALKDIGLSTADVLIETQRPLWDAPSNWRG
ncbi:DUF1127 domain-containing protein [Aestuariibius sp. HNIBRBA575]|uniref:DUF1127 domain-containing protein n=1 Tax=Aestuariibius sp. HNIBRBA575 TaxID=3233343 RepID=UPI0034A54F0E